MTVANQQITGNMQKDHDNVLLCRILCVVMLQRAEIQQTKTPKLTHWSN